MKLTYAQIIAQHQILQKTEAAPVAPERVEQVKAFIADVVAAGADIADPRQREQLRSILRYWSAWVYDQTKEFPPSQLVPFSGTGAGGPRLNLISLGPWLIAGAALLVIIIFFVLQTRAAGRVNQIAATASAETVVAAATDQAQALILTTTAGAGVTQPTDTALPPTETALAIETPTRTTSVLPTPSPERTATAAVAPTEASGSLFSLQGHAGTVNSLAFSPDGKTLVSGGSDSAIKLWNLDNQTLMWMYSAGNYVIAAAFSPDGQLVAYGIAGGELGILNAASGQITARQMAHTDNIASVAFSPDGTRLASGSVGGTPDNPDAAIALWVPDTLVRITFFIDTPPLSMNFSPDGRWLAFGSTDYSVKMRDIETNQRLTFGSHDNIVTSVMFSPDGKLLASGSADGRVKVWSVESRQLLATLGGQTTQVYGVAFSPDGKRLAAGGADADGKGLIEIWNVEAALQNQPQQPVTLAGHSQLIRTIAFSPDGKRLASGGRDNVVIVWRVP